MKTGSLGLICIGLLSVGFFVATDPRLGWGLRLDRSPQSNRIDAAHDAMPATLVGVTGGSLVTLAGLWLATRRIR